MQNAVCSKWQRFCFSWLLCGSSVREQGNRLLLYMHTHTTIGEAVCSYQSDIIHPSDHTTSMVVGANQVEGILRTKLDAQDVEVVDISGGYVIISFLSSLSLSPLMPSLPPSPSAGVVLASRSTSHQTNSKARDSYNDTN